MSAKEEKKILSELRKSVKALRDAHTGKSVTKMSAEELAREKSHHETAVRAMEVKAKRMEGLAKHVRHGERQHLLPSRPRGRRVRTHRRSPRRHHRRR